MNEESNSTKDYKHLTSGTLLAKNSLLNLTSKVLPMVVALISIPVLIQYMGKDRFGVLALTWTVIGYFSLLDLGLGRTLTYFIAGEIVDLNLKRLGGIVGTVLVVMLGMGLVGGLLIFLLSEWLVVDIFSIEASLHQEAYTGFQVLALAIPFTILATAFRGFLQAYQSFKKLTVVQIIRGTLSYGGVLVVVMAVSNHLAVVIGYLMVLKIATMIALLYLCKTELPEVFSHLQLRTSLLGELFRYGGWITVSNVIAPIIEQLDRFIIGMVITMAAVTYYTTPFDLVQRLNVIPTAMVGVLFPAFTTSFRQNVEKSEYLLKQGINITMLIMTPVVIAFVLFSDEIMYYWLGKEFVVNSSTILKIFAAGILFNNMAQIPFAFLQGISRPDLTAKIHLIELVVVAVCLWPAIQLFGILGAALLRVVRIFGDFLALIFFVNRLTNLKIYLLRWIIQPLLFVALVYLVEYWIDAIAGKLILFGVFSAGIGGYGWFKLLSLKQRELITGKLQKFMN